MRWFDRFDPLAEMKIYALYPGQEEIARQSYWSLKQYDMLPVEPIPLRDWLWVIGEFLLELKSLFKQQFVSQKVQPDRPTVSEILAYPLYSPEESENRFSLN